MEVYVLVHSYQFDSGDCSEQVVVFDSLSKAIKLLKKLKKEAKRYFKETYGDIEEGKTDMSYSVWEQENYCYNHEDITIYQREIN